MTAVALTKPAETTTALREGLSKFSASYLKLLPKSYPVDRLITGALIAATTNPALLKCSTVSVATALARVAQWGLDIGETAHLVPYGDKCTAVADYKGIIKLMCEAGARKVEAREVREGDQFNVRYGSDPEIVHIPKGSRQGAITHYYAVVWLRGGVVQFEVMEAAEVDALRKQYSKQWKNGDPGPWYGRKTTIKRLGKYVPKTPKLADALAADGYDPETGEVLPQPMIELPADEAIDTEDDGA